MIVVAVVRWRVVLGVLVAVIHEVRSTSSTSLHSEAVESANAALGNEVVGRRYIHGDKHGHAADQF